MFKNLFKPKAADFIAPMNGRMLKLEEVPDPVFSSKTIGDGFAIELADGRVCSPVNGEVVALFPTLHAIGIKSDDRNEYLIHVGLDTVKYGGEGFQCFVEMGTKVKANEPLIQVDMELYKEREVSFISPVIVTNLNGRKVRLLKEGNVTQGEKDILAIVV